MLITVSDCSSSQLAEGNLWLQRHAVFITAIAGALYESDCDARLLAHSAEAVCRLIVAVREGWAGAAPLALRTRWFAGGRYSKIPLRERHPGTQKGACVDGHLAAEFQRWLAGSLGKNQFTILSNEQNVVQPERLLFLPRFCGLTPSSAAAASPFSRWK